VAPYASTKIPSIGRSTSRAWAVIRSARTPLRRDPDRSGFGITVPTQRASCELSDEHLIRCLNLTGGTATAALLALVACPVGCLEPGRETGSVLTVTPC
jgi:hypothetical protein